MADRFSRGVNRNHVSAPCPRGDLSPAPCASLPTSPSPSLLHRLQALDFSLADTALYLDAYPHSAEALAHYRALAAERAELLRRLAEERRPITPVEGASADAWHWIDSPWPWEPNAN